MIHLLSTHGYLVTFNFINLTNPTDICSEPHHLNDLSGFSNFVIENIKDEVKEPQKNDAQSHLSNNAAQQQNFNLKQHLTQNTALTIPAPVSAPSGIDFSFTIPSGATSTPATNNKPISFFDSTNFNNKQQTNVFGLVAQPQQQQQPSFQQQQQPFQQQQPQQQATPSSDGTTFNSGNNFSFSFANADNTAIKIDNTVVKQATTPSATTTATLLDQSQNPLITIPSTYIPPKNIQSESVFSLPV